MVRLNRMGYTMIEVLAVIVIIAIVVGIAIPNVIGTIHTSKGAALEIVVENIKHGAENMYFEVENSFSKDKNGNIISNMKDADGSFIKIQSNYMVVSLQGMVSNGFLSGTTDDDVRKIIDPSTGEDIGGCYVKVFKCDVDDYAFTYLDSQGGKCPDLGSKVSC